MNRERLANRLQTIILQLQSIQSELAASAPALPPEAAQRLADRVCLLCGKKIAKAEHPLRGDHEKCYRRVGRRVKAGEISDAGAVEAGLWAPRGEAGRPSLPVDQLDKLGQAVAAEIRKENTK
jgi:hypothetical protein